MIRAQSHVVIPCVDVNFVELRWRLRMLRHNRPNLSNHRCKPMSIFLSVQSQNSPTNPPRRPTSLTIFVSIYVNIFITPYSQTSPADPPRRCPPQAIHRYFSHSRARSAPQIRPRVEICPQVRPASIRQRSIYILIIPILTV